MPMDKDTLMSALLVASCAALLIGIVMTLVELVGYG